MPQAQTQNPVVANANARAYLLATGIKMVKHLPLTTGAQLGQTVRIPLLRMGIMTGVLLQFTVPLGTVAGAPTASPFGPWNIAQQVQYTDFTGTNRTKTNGFQLWCAQSFKHNELLGATPFASGFGNADTDILTYAAPTTGANVTFSLYVPMAYDPQNDLTGAVLTQTNVGEHYISVTLANALMSTDAWAAPFINGGTTPAVPLGTAGITIDAFQFYIQPQAMDVNNLPLIDLATIYGFEGGYQTTANIAAGQSTYINYPNNRSVLSSLITFENGNTVTQNGADISGITLVANSNTNFREMTPRSLRELMRQIVGGDVAQGTYYTPHRRQPILTRLYANVQNRFDVAGPVNAGVTQFISQFEVQYPSGAPLPGITA